MFSSIRKLSAIAGAAALLLGPTLGVEQTIHWLSTQAIVPMSREEAYALTSIVGDCRVSQVVDIRKGVHCMIPKSVFVRKLLVR